MISFSNGLNQGFIKPQDNAEQGNDSYIWKVILGSLRAAPKKERERIRVICNATIRIGLAQKF